jgi:membrane-bound ClpP family serine protease
MNMVIGADVKASMSDKGIRRTRNKALSIVKQAVFELESKPSKATESTKPWHDSFLGKILIAVISGILLFIATLLLRKYLLTEDMPQPPQQTPAKTITKSTSKGPK